VILNAPGNPAVAIDRVLGEVSLKNGLPGTYDVELSSGNDACQPTGQVLTTNANGFGNAHIDVPTTGNPFYIVLRAMTVTGASTGDEVYASTPVALH
jgi:hypothetical protein